MALIGSLRQAQKVLAAKIAEKVYKYGFLQAWNNVYKKRLLFCDSNLKIRISF